MTVDTAIGTPSRNAPPPRVAEYRTPVDWLTTTAARRPSLSTTARLVANHGPWDYLGGMLVLLEAGGIITDLRSRPLVVDDHAARRAPVAAATPELHAALVSAEQGMG